MYAYYSLFIHSAVDGHLDFPHVLAIENNTAVNVGGKSDCVPPFTLPGYTSGSGVAATLYFLTSNAPGFQFLHIFTNTCYFLIFFFFIIAILLGLNWLSL